MAVCACACINVGLLQYFHQMIIIPENDPWTKEGYTAQTAAIELRRQEIEPMLGKVITAATASYERLMPHAKHVASVPRDYPIRRSGAVALSPLGGFSDPVSADLYVRFSDEHRISISHDLRVGYSEFPLWKLSRHEAIDDNLYSETQITYWGPNGPNSRYPHQAQVSRWKYGYVGGDKHCGDIHDKIISHYGNGWFSLEDHLNKIHQDLSTTEELIK